jgi:hypothetical protein
MNKDTRNTLVTPFPDDAVSSRRGSHGKTLQYIETWRVIDRLNDAFGHDWSWRVLEWQLVESEIVVVAELDAGGVVKHGFGNSTITRGKDSGEPVNIGDDVKSAASDALKKAATLFGVGLELYSGRTKKPAATTTTPATPPRSTPGRATERQQRAILSIAGNQGLSEPQIRTRILDGFGVPLEQLSRRVASELITKLNTGQTKKAEEGAA